METVEIVMDVEDHFHIHIPDAAAANCITVADLQVVVVDLLVAQGQERSESLRRGVWDGIMSILADNGYEIADIRPESKWVGDITTDG